MNLGWLVCKVFFYVNNYDVHYFEVLSASALTTYKENLDCLLSIMLIPMRKRSFIALGSNLGSRLRISLMHALQPSIVGILVCN